MLTTLFYFTGIFGDSSERPDTLKIYVANYTVSRETPFIIKDSMHIRVLRNRMQQIKSMLDDFRAESGYTEPSMLGYNGLGLYGKFVEDLSILNAFNGHMAVLTSGYSSRIDYLNDFNSETEFLIAKVGLSEDLSIMVDSKKIMFSSLIPDELKRVYTQYGVVTLELLSDTFDIDFSRLGSRLSYVPPRDNQPIFKDIQITRAREVSSSQFAFRISAPEGIAQVNPTESITGNLIYFSKPVDSIMISTIPVLDSLSTNRNSIQFETHTFFSPDVHRNSYLIKTADLGIVYLQPISFYIGAIDRIAFLWVYSSDSTFDMEALKKFQQQTIIVQSSNNQRVHQIATSNRCITISGRVLPKASTLQKTERGAGYYLKNDKKSSRPILSVK